VLIAGLASGTLIGKIVRAAETAKTVGACVICFTTSSRLQHWLHWQTITVNNTRSNKKAGGGSEDVS